MLFGRAAFGFDARCADGVRQGVDEPGQQGVMGFVRRVGPGEGFSGGPAGRFDEGAVTALSSAIGVVEPLEDPSEEPGRSAAVCSARNAATSALVAGRVGSALLPRSALLSGSRSSTASGSAGTGPVRIC